MQILASLTLEQAATHWAIFVIATGVFLGNLAWGIVSAIGKWWLADAGKRELEETIARGVARSTAGSD